MSDTSVIAPMHREGRAALAQYGDNVQHLRGQWPTREDWTMALGRIPRMRHFIVTTSSGLLVTIDAHPAAKPPAPAADEWATLRWADSSAKTKWRRLVS